MNPFNTINNAPSVDTSITNTENFFNWLIKPNKDLEVTVNELGVVITIPFKDDILCLIGLINSDNNTFDVNLLLNDEHLLNSITGLYQIINMNHLANLTLNFYTKEIKNKLVYTNTNSR